MARFVFIVEGSYGYVVSTALITNLPLCENGLLILLILMPLADVHHSLVCWVLECW